MAPRKAVEQELSREQILDVARQLFLSHGYHGVSMREIAKQMGYSHGAIYYHFKNKADLFHSLVKRDFTLLDATMTAIVDRDHTLKDVLLGFIQFGFTHPHHYEIMFMSKHESFEEMQSPITSYGRFVEEVGKFDVSPENTYFIFLSLHGFISYHLRSNHFTERGLSLAESQVDFLLQRLD